MLKKSLLILLLSVLTVNLTAENRTALVIGNSEYTHFSRLDQLVGEAQEISDALQRLGFEVILLLDASQDMMFDTLIDFEERLKERSGLALFYYCGHGVQVTGSNFLIPVDADIPDLRYVRRRAVEVDEVLWTMESSGCSSNIVILDACRDNPLYAALHSLTLGLAPMSGIQYNFIVVYSAKAGRAAREGLFAPALLNHLETPGLGFAELLENVNTDVFEASENNQRIGVYGQLENDVYPAGRKSSSP